MSCRCRERHTEPPPLHQVCFCANGQTAQRSSVPDRGVISNCCATDAATVRVLCGDIAGPRPWQPPLRQGDSPSEPDHGEELRTYGRSPALTTLQERSLGMNSVGWSLTALSTATAGDCTSRSYSPCRFDPRAQVARAPAVEPSRITTAAKRAATRGAPPGWAEAPDPRGVATEARHGRLQLR